MGSYAAYHDVTRSIAISAR